MKTGVYTPTPKLEGSLFQIQGFELILTFGDVIILLQNCIIVRGGTGRCIVFTCALSTVGYAVKAKSWTDVFL